MNTPMRPVDFRVEVNKTTQIFGRNPDIKVVMKGNAAGCHRDGWVLLPSIPEAAELSPSEVDQLRGYVDHETAHLRYTPLDQYFKYGDHFKACKQPAKASLMNALEDMRIEAKATRDYPGAITNIDATAMSIVENLEKQGWPDDPRSYFPLAITVAGRIQAGTPSAHRMQQWLDSAPCQKTVSMARRYAQQAIDTASIDDNLQALRNIKSLVDKAYDEAGYDNPPEDNNDDGNPGDQADQHGSTAGGTQPQGTEGNAQGGDDQSGEGEHESSGSGEPGSRDRGTDQNDDPDGADSRPTGGQEDTGGGSEDDQASETGGMGDSGGESGGDMAAGQRPDVVGDDADPVDTDHQGDPAVPQGSEDMPAHGQSDGEGEGDTPERGAKDGTQQPAGNPGKTQGRFTGEIIDADLTQAAKSIANHHAQDGDLIYTDQWDVTGDVNTDPLANAYTFQRIFGRFRFPKGVDLKARANKTCQEIAAGRVPLWGQSRFIDSLLEETYQEALDQGEGKTAVMASRLERMLKGIAPRRWASGHKSGRLDPRRLTQAYQGKEQVWLGRVPKQHVDTSVIILIDQSGSMTEKEKDKMTSATAILLAEALERTPINYQVMGMRELFPTGREGVVRPEVTEEYRNKQFTLGYQRVCPLMLPIYKPFDSALAQCRKGMGAIKNDQAMGGLPDACGIRAASKLLADTKSTRKVLITLSDGDPSTTWANKAASVRNLHQAIAECESMDIQCLGIGILSPAVSRYYPRSTVVRNVDNLATTVMDELAIALTGHNLRTAV